MKHLFKKVVTKFGLGVIGLSLFASLFSVAMPGAKVHAVGETYTWTSYNTILAQSGLFRSGTVTVSTGTFDSGVLTLTPSLPGDQTFDGHVLVNDTQTTFNCVMRLQVSLRNGQTLSFASIDELSKSPGQNVDQGGCPDFVLNAYNNKNITISGTRGSPGDVTETSVQKQVNFSVGGSGAASSPATISLAVSVISTPDPVPQPIAPVILTKNANGDYSGIKEFLPGTYKVCDDIGIGCATFTKVKFTPLISPNDVHYGMTLSAGSIAVTVELPVGAGRNVNVPALTVTATRSGGATLTAMTTPLDALPSGDQNGGGTGLQSTLLTYATITGADAGDYNICVNDTTCKTLTKGSGPASITIHLDIDTAAALITDSSTGSGSTTCEVKILDPLSWFLCPIVNSLGKIVTFLENTVVSMLDISDKEYSDNDKLHKAWSSLAKASGGFLVLTTLIMVISTATDIGPFSSYTVKKVLPRIAVATLGIMFSWTLMSNYISFMNDVGHGVRGLMLAPFGPDVANLTLGGTLIKAGGGQVGAEVGITGILLASAIGASVLTLFGVIGLLFTAASGFFIAFVVLVLRKVVIVVLMVTAPVAIASYVLPNTQKLWKIWWDTFNSLLLMFPIIVILFTSGKIFSFITAYSVQGSTNPAEAVVKFFVTLVAFVAPLFLVPATFKLAGDLFGRLTGMVNNPSKGFLDRGRKSLDDRAKYRQGLKSDQKRRDAVGNLQNRGISGVAARWRVGTTGQGTAVRRSTRSAFERGDYKLEQDRLKNSNEDERQRQGLEVNKLQLEGVRLQAGIESANVTAEHLKLEASQLLDRRLAGVTSDDEKQDALQSLLVNEGSRNEVLRSAVFESIVKRGDVDRIRTAIQSLENMPDTRDVRGNVITGEAMAFKAVQDNIGDLGKIMPDMKTNYRATTAVLDPTTGRPTLDASGTPVTAPVPLGARADVSFRTFNTSSMSVSALADAKNPYAEKWATDIQRALENYNSVMADATATPEARTTALNNVNNYVVTMNAATTSTGQAQLGPEKSNIINRTFETQFAGTPQEHILREAIHSGGERKIAFDRTRGTLVLDGDTPPAPPDPEWRDPRSYM